jgi:flagella basal body P-ring formation protein FlgA
MALSCLIKSVAKVPCPCTRARGNVRDSLIASCYLSLALEMAGAMGVAAQEKAARTDPGQCEVVVVTLRGAATVPDPHVYIEDVAQIQGGSFPLRQQIAKLDLSDLPSSEPSAPIPREQIYFRIRLAGVESGQFRVVGAGVVRVSLASKRLTEKEILAAATQAVLRHLPRTTDDISVQLAEPLRSPVNVPEAREKVRLDVELPATGIPLGRVHGELVVFLHETLQSRTPIWLDVKLHELVAVSTRRIERGELLTKDNVYFDRRTLTDLNDYLTLSQGLAGRRAKRALAAGQLLTGQDLEGAGEDNPVLIKPQGLVKLVARLGPLQITAMGEALQEGRTGQLIRVRNLDSKSTVVGRVVDRSLVEVDY